MTRYVYQDRPLQASSAVVKSTDTPATDRLIMRIISSSFSFRQATRLFAASKRWVQERNVCECLLKHSLTQRVYKRLLRN